MHLLLIGGGEIGAQRSDGSYRPLETLAIDKYFLKAINKNNPKVLFIPTAIEQRDPNKLYEKAFKRLYGEQLNCNVDVLNTTDTASKEYFSHTLSSCDAIYISGGDTKYMLNRWKETGFNALLKKEILNGKITAGISAGAMCWFEKVLAEDENLSLIDGLGLFKNMCIPHWNKYKDVFLDKHIIQTTPFIAIDNCCAVEIMNETINLISSKENASAYYYDISNDKYAVDLIEKGVESLNVKIS